MGVRSAVPLMCEFIIEHRQGFGVAPITPCIDCSRRVDRSVYLLGACGSFVVEARVVGGVGYRSSGRLLHAG